MSRLTKLIEEMIRWDANPARVGHFLKVYGYAKTIGESEDMDEGALETLEAAAIVHDIGIRPSLEKYGSDAGPYQEQEGPQPALEMAQRCGYGAPQAKRIAWLVGHHHTYKGVEEVDHQVLLEADLLVNLEEHNTTKKESGASKVFRTKLGRQIYQELFADQEAG